MKAADVRELTEKIRLLGQDHVQMERYIAELTKVKVPEFVGGDASKLLEYMPLNRALEIISKAQEPPAAVPDTAEPGNQELPARDRPPQPD